MKNFKKITLLLAAIIFAVIPLFSLVACIETEEGNKSVTLVVDIRACSAEAKDGYESGFKTLEAETEALYLLGLLSELAEQKRIEFDATVSSTGAFLTSFDGIISEANCYFMIYMTPDEKLSNGLWGTYNYKGETLNSAALGMSSLPLKNGYTYVIVYEDFSKAS